MSGLHNDVCCKPREALGGRWRVRRRCPPFTSPGHEILVACRDSVYGTKLTSRKAPARSASDPKRTLGVRPETRQRPSAGQAVRNRKRGLGKFAPAVLWVAKNRLGLRKTGRTSPPGPQTSNVPRGAGLGFPLPATAQVRTGEALRAAFVAAGAAGIATGVAVHTIRALGAAAGTGVAAGTRVAAG